MSRDPRFDRLRADTFAALRPPPKLRLSDWAEAHVRLPSSLSAQPGPMRLWPQQREILDTIGDDTTPRVSILKSARVGATQAMVAALGHFTVNEPSPVLVTVPAEGDARAMMVANVEPTFRESPALRQALSQDTTRETLLSRRFPGGSLDIVSARAPRNLRARTARLLLADEIDGYDIDGYEIDLGGEGDPVELAIRRTMTFGNRKIVLASTPLDEETSRIVRAYGQSDRRAYEVPCPGCGASAQVLWADIRWPQGDPEAAHWATPRCGTVVEDRQKAGLVENGRWRATEPAVRGHAGFYLTRPDLDAAERLLGHPAAGFVQAKRSPTTLKTFVNTVWGEPWRAEGDEVDPAALSARQRPHSLDAATLPEDVLFLTAGADMQDDRVELSWVGWTGDGDARVLAHEVVWGKPQEDATWQELDALLSRHWAHPLGGLIRLDATVIDSGNWADQVYAFTRPRTSRRIVAGKGVAGFARPSLAWGASRKTRLALIGVDAIKLAIHQRLAHGDTLTISDRLGQDYLDQLDAERLVTRYSRGHTVRQWEKISGRRNEALDCLAYAFAARQLVPVNPDAREAELTGAPRPAQRPAVVRSSWLAR